PLPRAADGPAPSAPSAAGWAISEAAEEPTSGRTRGEKRAPTAEIEFAGAEERIVPFPVSSGVFRELEAVEAGLLWMRAGDAEGGELGSKHAGATGDKPAEAMQVFAFD